MSKGEINGAEQNLLTIVKTYNLVSHFTSYNFVENEHLTLQFQATMLRKLIHSQV
jgi:hypothetical protein